VYDSRDPQPVWNPSTECDGVCFSVKYEDAGEDVTHSGCAPKDEDYCSNGIDGYVSFYLTHGNLRF